MKPLGREKISKCALVLSLSKIPEKERLREAGVKEKEREVENWDLRKLLANPFGMWAI